MIFLKRWIADNKITQGEIDEYQKQAIARFHCKGDQGTQEVSTQSY
jgi:hypothetical protein